MKAVLFIEGKELQSSFQRSRHLFDSLVTQGSLCVCDWDASSYLPAAANEFVGRVVGEDEPWSAVVVCDVGGRPGGAYHANPYDLVGNAGPWDQTEFGQPSPPGRQHPAVALGQLLGGMPAHVRDEGSVGLSLSQVDGLRTRYDAAGLSSGLTGEEADDAFRAWVHERYAETGAQGYGQGIPALNAPRPVALSYVSHRDVPAQASASDVQEAAGTPGAVASDFCARNHYPDQARFFVVDREEVGSPERRKAETAFWAGVLALALNPDAVFRARPYAVYQLQAVVDYEAYAAALSERRALAASGLTMADELLEEARAKLAPSNKREVPDARVSLTVDYRQPFEHELSEQPRRYGWLKDSCRAHRSWFANVMGGLRRLPARLRSLDALDDRSFQRDWERSGELLGQALFSAAHALDQANADFAAQSRFEADVLSGFRGTERQVAELEALLNEHELRAAGAYAPFTIDPEACQRLLDARAAEVRARLRLRAYAREVALCGAAVALAGLFVLIPALALGDAARLLWAALVGLRWLLLMVLVACIPFYLELLKLRRDVRELGEALARMSDELLGRASAHERQLRALATYRKGHGLLARQGDGVAYTRETLDLERARAALAEVVGRLDADVRAADAAPMAGGPAAFASWGQARSAAFDPASFSVEPSWPPPRCAFNASVSSGEEIDVPFGFIRSVDLRRVRVYEPGYERGREAL